MASLYFTSRIVGDSKPMAGITKCHPREALVATGWGSNRVLITTDDGERLAVITRVTTPTTIVWHPTKRMVAIGWRDGQVTLWQDTSRFAANAAQNEGTTLKAPVHDNLAVVGMCWTTGGNTLLTASKSCAIGVWQLESGATSGAAAAAAKTQEEREAAEMTFRLVMAWSSKTEMPVSTVTHLANHPDAVAAGAEGDDEVCFALTTVSSSTVFVLSESQRVTSLIDHPSDFTTNSLLWDCYKRRLLTIADNNLIALHRIDEDLKTTPVFSKRKIAVGKELKPESTSACWAPGNTIALSCGEDLIRMFDMDSEVVYNLRLPDDVLPVEAEAAPHQVTAVASFTGSMSNNPAWRVASTKAATMLAVGTSTGKVVIFAYTGKQIATEGETVSEEDSWDYVTTLTAAGGPVEGLRMLHSGAIAVTTTSAVSVMQEAFRRRKWASPVGVVQYGPEKAMVSSTVNMSQDDPSLSVGNWQLNSSSKIRELDMSFPQVALWSGQKLDVHTVNETTGSTTLLTSEDYTSSAFAVHAEGVIKTRQQKVVFESYQKQPHGTLSFTDTEGLPKMIDCSGDFACIVTETNHMRVARISLRDMRPLGPTRTPFQAMPGVTVTKASINPKGKLVAFLVKGGNIKELGYDPSHRVFVYELDTDKLKSYDFAQTHEVPESLCWNTAVVSGGGVGSAQNNNLDLDSLLLAVETRAASTARASNKVNVTIQGDGEEPIKEAFPKGVATLFVAHTLHTTTGGGVVLHHREKLTDDQVCLVGCTVPYIYLSSTAPTIKTTEGPPSPSNKEPEHRIERIKLRDFRGMGPQAETDLKLRDALMRFGYYATLGNMDEAYRAIKAVKDTTVWENLARLCIATKRLDVAEVCIANMQNGVAARELREARSEPEVEAQLGLLAVSLGMIQEATALFEKAKRPDLITRLLLASNQWDEAQAHTEANDHIRIFSVSYQRAQLAEDSGNVKDALGWYEKAQCCGSEVPRLLIGNSQMADLKTRVANATKCLKDLNEADSYDMASSKAKKQQTSRAMGPKKESPEDATERKNSRDLLLWWAQYQESTGDSVSALQHYEVIRDVFNVVRILCASRPPKIDEAISIVSNPNNSEHVGAAYFIGRHFEDESNTRSALQYLNMAGATRRAVRLAKRADMHADIVSIVLSSNDKALALECAKYFDDRSMHDRAAQLYQKGGDTQRAIDVCIRGGLYDQLHQISESLDSAADPETFISMAEHFIKSKHYDKAVQMLVFAKAFNEALQLCMDKDVKLTDEMAETMTLPKSDNAEEEEYRIALLKKAASVAKDQGSYHLACKKYTQAGERVKALKMLLKAGDTEKVIFFANHSRSAEIYVLAANFLQSQKWQTDPNIYKTIVQFYTKAKNFESLALFYDSCAQLQIDEYRDYDKALSTLNDAMGVLTKAGDAISSSKRDNFAERIRIVEQFVRARQSIKPGQESVETEDACNDLISRGRKGHIDYDLIDSAIRVGDVYALLVEYYEKQGKFPQAFTAVSQMKSQEIELSYFLEAGLVEKICKKVGEDPTALLEAQLNSTQNAPRHDGEDLVQDDDDFLEEEV